MNFEEIFEEYAILYSMLDLGIDVTSLFLEYEDKMCKLINDINYDGRIYNS